MLTGLLCLWRIVLRVSGAAGCGGHRFGHRAVCQSLSPPVECFLQSVCVHRSGTGALDAPPNHHAHPCRYENRQTVTTSKILTGQTVPLNVNSLFPCNVLQKQGSPEVSDTHTSTNYICSTVMLTLTLTLTETSVHVYVLIKMSFGHSGRHKM